MIVDCVEGFTNRAKSIFVDTNCVATETLPTVEKINGGGKTYLSFVSIRSCAVAGCLIV